MVLLLVNALMSFLTTISLLSSARAFSSTCAGSDGIPRLSLTTDDCAITERSVLVSRGGGSGGRGNHPSQNARFSSADEQITHRLKSALDLVDVRVLDHLSVAGSDVISLVERGII